MTTVLVLGKMFLTVASAILWFVFLGAILLAPLSTWEALTWFSLRKYGKYADISSSVTAWSILLLAIFWSCLLLWIW